MAKAWLQVPGPMSVVLSRRDDTALEFHEAVTTLEQWRGTLERAGVRCEWIADADHTFSHPAHRMAVVDATTRLLELVNHTARDHVPGPEGQA